VISNKLLVLSVHVMRKLESVIDHCDSYLKNVKCVHCSRTNLLPIEVHKRGDVQQKVDNLSQKSYHILYSMNGDHLLLTKSNLFLKKSGCHRSLSSFSGKNGSLINEIKLNQRAIMYIQ